MTKYNNLIALASVFLLWFAGFSTAQNYTLSNLQFLPGDNTIETSVNDQSNSRISAGGPGFLVVWEDDRTDLSGFPGTPTNPFMGNQTDIYAARLDSAGNILDDSPIIITNEAIQQTKPEVAWNGENWLVVYVTQRPDWYFFTDIYATRVSPDGVVLDTPPIPIRLENNSPSNDYGQNPSVSSDGNNWAVFWQDQTWQGFTPYPNLEGIRIAPDGTILDDPPLVLYQGTIAATFGPSYPHMAFAEDEFLLAWEKAGYHQIFGRRLNPDLTPIDQNEFLIANSYNEHPRVASNGTDFFVVSRDKNGYRVNHTGQVLDPGGIYFGTASGAYDRGSETAWDGTYWVAAYNGGSIFASNIYLTRITTSGMLVAPGPTEIQFTADDQFNAAVGSNGDGSVVSVWDQRDENLTSGENIRSMRVDGSWGLSNEQDVSVGLHRQTRINFASNGEEHLALYLSQGGGQTLVLAQRIDQDGNPIDIEPNVVTQLPETYSPLSGGAPKVVFNGSEYLVVWGNGGSVFGRRLDLNGTPIDPDPVNIVTDNVVAAAVGALNGAYYLVYSYVVSGDQIYLKGARFDSNTMTLIDSPVFINPSTTSYALAPNVYGFGTRWLVVWEAQINHDQPPSTIRGIFIDSNGQANPPFIISQGGYGDDPAAAISENRAFVTWYDNSTTSSFKIEGRLMNPDGSYIGDEFLIADANNQRISTTASWDGNQFVSAWTDFRSITGIVDQLRGDIWAARVDYDGNVLDLGGIQLTSGELPEDLPAAAGYNGKTVIAFSKLNGISSLEVQRIGHRVLENSSVSPVTITLTPLNPPIVIPASGGNVNYGVYIENISASPQNFSAWLDLAYEGGNPTTVIQRSFTNFQPGWTIDRPNMFLPIPAAYPAGNYTMTGKVGNYPSNVWEESSFPFTKSGIAEQNAFIPFTPDGIPDPFAEIMDENPGEIGLPTKVALNPAYPNPFNPVTTLNFSLPEMTVVKLSIYNVSGQLVSTLIDGVVEAGNHSIEFNGKNLSSGIYLTRLVAGNSQFIQKLMLIK